MANRYVTVGGKQIPIVAPKRDLTIASRLPGGKYEIPSQVEPPPPIDDSFKDWMHYAGANTENGQAESATYLTQIGWLAFTGANTYNAAVAAPAYEFGADNGFMLGPIDSSLYYANVPSATYLEAV